MTEKNGERWTSEHLTRPGGTGLYAAQQRARLRRMADEVQALLGEYRSALEEVRIEGDRPFEPWFRAFFASRPLARLEKDLRRAVNEAGKLDAKFQRRYVELPVKRREKAENKALEKDRKAGLNRARAVNTTAQIQSVYQGVEEYPAGDKGLAKNGQQGESTFLDFLQREA
jgi:hypothetical protein